MVVDDEPGIRSLLDLLLTRAGYRVKTVSGGREAIHLLQTAPDGVDAVLLDVRMPDLDGPATLVELLRLRPDLPCCFLSGYTGLYESGDLRELGARAFLSKPFRPEVLLEIVDSLVRQTVVD